MTVKEKVLKLVEQYTKKIESLKEQEKVIFETVYKLNSDVIQLENKKYNEVIGSENINVNRGINVPPSFFYPFLSVCLGIIQLVNKIIRKSIRLKLFCTFLNKCSDKRRR